MNRPAPIVAGSLAALLLLFGAYMGSYYAMLLGPTWSDNVGMLTPPIYRWEEPAVHAFFGPANRLDRLLRPNYWRP